MMPWRRRENMPMLSCSNKFIMQPKYVQKLPRYDLEKKRKDQAHKAVQFFFLFCFERITFDFSRITLNKLAAKFANLLGMTIL